MSSKKQNFLQGALILSAAAIIVKIIGAAYKIPLMNIIGGEGFGYYNTAYTIFTPFIPLPRRNSRCGRQNGLRMRDAGTV